MHLKTRFGRPPKVVKKRRVTMRNNLFLIIAMIIAIFLFIVAVVNIGITNAVIGLIVGLILAGISNLGLRRFLK